MKKPVSSLTTVKMRETYWSAEHRLVSMRGRRSAFGRKRQLGAGRPGDPNHFRAELPISALAVAVTPENESKTTVQDDIRMFLLSFIAFFMAFSLFIL